MAVFVLYILQDNTQRYREGSKSVLVLRDSSVSFSFIAAFHPDERILEKSILSIEDIGDELGQKYEIILPMDNRSSQSSLLSDLSRKIENVRVIRFANNNRGFQKRMMQSTSLGSYVVIFDPSTVYGIEFADLLFNFCQSRDEIVLYSDLIVIPSVIFKRVGTWRDLRDSEDLDILARIVAVTGLIVYNPNAKDITTKTSEPVILRTGKLPMSPASMIQLLTRQRDQIIGSAFRFRDLYAYYRIRKMRSVFRFLLVTVSYVFSKLWSIHPSQSKDSNYTIVMDRVLESLILADFRRYPGFAGIPKIRLTENDLEYLMRSGKVWSRIVEKVDNYVEKL